MKQYRIDVNIVDDHAMFSEGLTEAINHSTSIHVSRSFTTLDACRQALRERRPDVLLLDIGMPDGSGAAFSQEIIADYPKIKVIAVTIHDEYSVIQRTLEAGIHGYLLKTSSILELLNAIQRVWQGEHYVSPTVETIIQQSEPHSVFLTTVERNVLRLICDGMTNPEIATKLCLSTETVNWYRKRLLSKYGVKNTVGLVTLVLNEKLL